MIFSELVWKKEFFTYNRIPVAFSPIGSNQEHTDFVKRKEFSFV